MAEFSRGSQLAIAVAAMTLLLAPPSFAEAPKAANTPTDGPPPLPAMVQWHTTTFGVQYAEITVGKGPEPKEGETVIVHFKGWLSDGTMFENSHLRDKPFGFPLGSGQVIRGWDEGIRGMRVGGTRRLIIPPDLGYGKQGIPGHVPPDSTLTFDIQLLHVVQK